MSSEGKMKNRKSNTALWSLSVIVLVTIIIVLTAYGFSEATSDVSSCVSLEREAWVKGEKVYLRDIAHIEGPDQLGKQLGAIYLAYAPKPGGHKTLRGTWIENKIRSKKWLPADTALKIPKSVKIKRTSQSVEDEQFLRLFNGYIAERLKGNQADFRVTRFRTIGNGFLPEGDIRFELSNQRDRDLMGQVSLNAIVRISGKIQRRVVLSGWVDRFEQVVCTVRQLQRQSLVTQDDVSLERRNVAKLPTNIAKAMEDVVGKRIKHAVRAGAVLLSNMLETPPLIERGDRVTVIAESSLLAVTVPGIAQSKGCAGDHIRVRNCMSKKEIVGLIIDASTVRVRF